MFNYNTNDTENIDLAYSYTQDFLKELKNDIKHLEVRLGTFLGFAGLLLRFNIDLSSNQPIYLFTKIAALFTSFCAIVIVSWALRSNPKRGIVDPSYLMEDEIFQQRTSQNKAMIINTHKIICQELEVVAYKKRNFLNQAIICLAFSTFFFAINGMLVSFLGN